MSTLVKNLKNSRKVLFDFGKFDNWCVFVVEKNGFKNAPKDVTYFTDLLNLAQFYPENKVYADFVSIYKLTNKNIDIAVIQLIDKIANSYNPEHKIIAEQWFTVIYAGMIAEENKENAILKKRIKMLGIYQVLILKMQAENAANFSKGKNWKELDTIMKSYGF